MPFESPFLVGLTRVEQGFSPACTADLKACSTLVPQKSQTLKDLEGREGQFQQRLLNLSALFMHGSYGDLDNDLPAVQLEMLNGLDLVKSTVYLHDKASFTYTDTPTSRDFLLAAQARLAAAGRSLDRLASTVALTSHSARRARAGTRRRGIVSAGAMILRSILSSWFETALATCTAWASADEDSI
jgi:hypothetical protein